MVTERTENERLLPPEWPPYRCSVQICGYSVGIYSPCVEFLPYFEGLADKEYRYDIPGWSISYRPQVGEPKIRHILARDSQFYYNSLNNVLTVGASGEDFLDGQALAYLCYWLTEGARQKDSSFSIHAASLSLEDKGILLIGDRGAGKTSVLLGTIQRYRGRLIGNDLTILKYNQKSRETALLEGSKRLRLRLRSVISNFPQLLEYFPNQTGSAWNTKILVDPRQLSIDADNTQILLSQAFIVHLSNDPSDQLRIHKVSGIEPFFELYENLARIIRGSAISVFGANQNILGYIPSLETETTHRNKVEFLNHLIKDKGLIFVSGGNLDRICEAIYRCCMR